MHYFVPIRQGTHCRDSSAVNSRKNFAVFTMQVLSSITTIPPSHDCAVFLTSSYETGYRELPGMQL
jgi:hypothetical protein